MCETCWPKGIRTWLCEVLSYERVGCRVLFSLTVVSMPGQMRSEAEVQSQPWLCFSEVISKAKHCSPVDVVNVRALQEATPGNTAWFWHRMLKRRHPTCDLSSQCLSMLGLGLWAASWLLSVGSCLWGLLARACEKSSADSRQTWQYRPVGHCCCPALHGCSARQGSSTERGGKTNSDLGSLHLPHAMRQENAERPLDTTTKLGVQLIHGVG